MSRRNPSSAAELPNPSFRAELAQGRGRLRDVRSFDDHRDPVLSRDITCLVAETTPLPRLA